MTSYSFGRSGRIDMPDHPAARILKGYLEDLERLSPADRERFQVQLQQCPLCAPCEARLVTTGAETIRFEANGSLTSVCREHASTWLPCES